MSVQPFKIDTPAAVLDDLRSRLGATRWPEAPHDSDWKDGTSAKYLKELVRYWERVFDWRADEQAINRFAQFRAEVKGIGIHFIHEHGRGQEPFPLILTHGYPDSFLRFRKLIPLLVDPGANGGDAADSFDVIIPSLPGYGFSDKPREPGVLFHIGDMWASLMTELLGYQQFGAHGGDWGSMVTEHLARSHASSVIGIHLTDVPFLHLFEKPKDLTHREQTFVDSTEKWQKKEGAYALIQGTGPQTLAYGLNDSPAGLAAWIVEKFRAWSDCNGDIETRFTKDELLSHITLYWVTGTIRSAFQLYSDAMNAGAMTWVVEMFRKWLGSTSVPAGFANFPQDIRPPPREWAERFFNIKRWTEMPRGGHFAAMEEPQLLAEDIRAFFRPLRSLATA
jgi:pimeloyl-ACP methyl ester carboxylesterase